MCVGFVADPSGERRDPGELEAEGAGAADRVRRAAGSRGAESGAHGAQQLLQERDASR